MESIRNFLFTKVASTTTFVIAVIGLSVYLLSQGYTKDAFVLLVTSLTLGILVNTTKNYLKVARPADARVETVGYAFPSGHAAGVAFLAFVIVFLTRDFQPVYWYTVIASSLLIAGIICYSRVMLKVHTWFQVLCGIVFGTFFSSIFIYASLY